MNRAWWAAAADSLQPWVVPVLCPASEGRDAGGEIVDAENPRRASAAVWPGAEPARDCRQRRAEHRRGEHVSRPRPDSGTGLAAAGGDRRCRAGGAALSAAAGRGGPSTPATRLG